MASFIQNYVQGMVQNAAVGAATYAITTGGRVVGDAVISAGDLIEGAGRNVGNSSSYLLHSLLPSHPILPPALTYSLLLEGVEGYIDRYGNWIRSYGDSAIAATAPSYTNGTTATKPKALPSSKVPKALPAPPSNNSNGKKGTGAARPPLKKSLSDSKTPLPLSSAKALPSAGVRKALPAAAGAAGKGQELSKGQLAKARGVKAEDLKKAGTKGVAGGVDGVKKGGTGLGGGVTKTAGQVGGAAAGIGTRNSNKAKQRGSGAGYAASVASTVTGNKQKETAGKPTYTASVAGGNTGSGAPAPRSSSGSRGQQQQTYPKPFSKKRPDGKVVIAKESKPGGGAAKATMGGAGKRDDRKVGGYDFLKADKKEGGGNKGMDGKGGFDFMSLMAEEPKKKGPGSVAGSVKTNGTMGKPAAVGAGGGKQETSGQYDFF
ncbi:hypothetical protein MPH_08124 [Macrophomina phaseolina MS6]|uniref:Uncharacterized protein n=1 Tax=Macrophomina phaseolina (strain MS6) TaxID=1126212 RepID=K2QXP1_MACPH|nr:hypothetical protein MPH_08124 [Macrophomina phaseolina MS6]